MKLFVISLCHMNKEVIEFSLNRFLETTTESKSLIKDWVIVEHHYPLKKEETADYIYGKAVDISAYNNIPCSIISPDKNLGGTEGYNFALNNLMQNHAIDHDDIILGYDPDSNPPSDIWLSKMLDVMNLDKSMAYLSLTHEGIKDNFKDDASVMIGTNRVIINRLDMFNITVWRAGFLMSEGLLGGAKFYGSVESRMHDKCLDMGLRHGYMADVFELFNPIPHDAEYNHWKREHASGEFKGNFDEYIVHLKDSSLWI